MILYPMQLSDVLLKKHGVLMLQLSLYSLSMMESVYYSNSWKWKVRPSFQNGLHQGRIIIPIIYSYFVSFMYKGMCAIRTSTQKNLEF